MSTVTRLPLSAFTQWLASGERGLSSNAIVAHLTGKPIGRYTPMPRDYPHDPDDFRRCQLLLEAVPIARLTFPSMRSVSPEWARLVDAWDDIAAAIEADAPGYLRAPHGKSSPRGYRLMKQAINDGLPCVACDSSGRSAPCVKCKGTGKRSGGRCRAKACFDGFFLCADCRGDGYTTRPAP